MFCVAVTPASLIHYSFSTFLQEKATKWEDHGVIDGLTTNGVLLLHLKGTFVGGGAKPLPWREVSVNGGLYTMRESRSAPQKGKKMDLESCVLEDGSMIDLCGVTLLWRSAEGLEKSPVSWKAFCKLILYSCCPCKIK